MQYNPPFGAAVVPGGAPYIDGNPATATAGSIPPAAAIEDPQREIMNAIIAAGLAPSDNDLTQLLQAIEILGRIPFCVDIGSVNHVVINPSPALTQYSTPLILAVQVAFSNAGATDVNVNGLGQVALITPNQQPLVSSALSAKGIILISFDGTYFQLLTPPAGPGAVSPPLTDLWHYGVDVSTVPNFVNVTTDNVGSAWAAGLPVAVKIANTNTAASNIQLNGFANVNITRGNGGALLPGDLVVGTIAVLIYDGTQAQLLNPHLSAASVYTGADVGTANAISVTSLSPTLTTILAGMMFDITKSAAANTSTATATIMGTAGPLRWADGSALAAGDWPANCNALFQFDGTNFNILSIMGPSVFARANQIGPSLIHYGNDTSGSTNTIIATVTPAITSYGIGNLFYIKAAHTNTGPVVANLNGLGNVPVVLNLTGAALTGGEINIQGGTESVLYYDGTNLRLLNPTLPQVWKVVAITTSGTYTPSANCTRIRVRAWGSGGGGATAFYGPIGTAQAGGGGGEYREGVFSVTPSVGIACTVQGTNTSYDTNGTDTVFGSLITCKAGQKGSGLTPGAGGTGGTGGSIVFAGGAGQQGYVSQSPYSHDCFPGLGGSTFGFSGLVTSTLQVGVGGAGGNPGVYFGGGASPNGGPGGVGLILVEEMP